MRGLDLLLEDELRSIFSVLADGLVPGPAVAFASVSKACRRATDQPRAALRALHDEVWRFADQHLLISEADDLNSIKRMRISVDATATWPPSSLPTEYFLISFEHYQLFFSLLVRGVQLPNLSQLELYFLVAGDEILVTFSDVITNGRALAALSSLTIGRDVGDIGLSALLTVIEDKKALPCLRRLTIDSSRASQRLVARAAALLAGSQDDQLPFAFLLHQLPPRAQDMILGHVAVDGIVNGSSAKDEFYQK